MKNSKEQLDLNMKIIKESNNDNYIKEMIDLLEEANTTNNKTISNEKLKKLSHTIYKDYASKRKSK